MARRGPRWYFSFRSPYSWMAYRDLMDHYPDVADRIEWLPFWEPDTTAQEELERSNIRLPYVPMSKEKHLYILQDVRRLARARGLEMVWPVDPAPRWEVAHLAYLAAADHGLGPQFIAETYRRRWQLGEDISQPDTMASVGKEIGLDPHVTRDAHENPEIRDKGLQMLNLLHRDGVFGVPYFIDGFDKFWGVDRLPGFVESVRTRIRKEQVKEG
ncbi:2-hydroxychromene-2-carboxylate isomerase [Streptomyces antimicrobicus]|uniref:2-hydroxychromene-2-carboxylate isomerase n=1 Tax=Streptomyces antimicrobicus TaxID=2883108 RepID=A0ABS8BA71_9ACTN|nr:DsbA family protein [Streptomyces antimicrobicus]MCB5181520.1 DsbA family protein [Streptomyces antimicrobicus]